MYSMQDILNSKKNSTQNLLLHLEERVIVLLLVSDADSELLRFF